MKEILHDGYKVRPSKKGNEPSFSLKDFGERKGVAAVRLKNSIKTDENTNPIFNRKKVDYYRISDLELWWSKNKHKFTG